MAPSPQLGELRVDSNFLPPNLYTSALSTDGARFDVRPDLPMINHGFPAYLEESGGDVNKGVPERDTAASVPPLLGLNAIGTHEDPALYVNPGSIIMYSRLTHVDGGIHLRLHLASVSFPNQPYRLFVSPFQTIIPGYSYCFSNQPSRLYYLLCCFLQSQIVEQSEVTSRVCKLFFFESYNI